MINNTDAIAWSDGIGIVAGVLCVTEHGVKSRVVWDLFHRGELEFKIYSSVLHQHINQFDHRFTHAVVVIEQRVDLREFPDPDVVQTF
jgi:hypothetical protein